MSSEPGRDDAVVEVGIPGQRDERVDVEQGDWH